MLDTMTTILADLMVQISQMSSCISSIEKRLMQFPPTTAASTQIVIVQRTQTQPIANASAKTSTVFPTTITWPPSMQMTTMLGTMVMPPSSMVAYWHQGCGDRRGDRGGPDQPRL
ncbi:hypothetical protein GUJ93_ZPchr0010g8509 [Zizania palustris]|uniref:Uncharacterized protein n=1 Tax=Zizania palustris TaxID=103762 RepID=A0A8J6BK34_ZIZPA|nr:hypothetical protein GUJ93_ZPchr0010g8509 [Zizania palustris]